MTYLFQVLFYQPVLNLLVLIFNFTPGHDLGVAIIILTIIIKLVLWPLSQKSLKSQKALQDLQPQIEEIKKKLKDKKDEMGRAIMELYKQNKVNPLSSCLPLLIQLPFLIAVFRVFTNGFTAGSMDLVYTFINRPAEINTTTLGIIDLSEKSIVLAILAGAAQFWQTKMLSSKQAPIKNSGAKDENMAAMMNKQMTYMMPVLTVFFGISLPGGLTFYWLITTLLTVAQQYLLFKKQAQTK